MKLFISIIMFIICMGLFIVTVHAQCSVCTKTALQLGEKPAQGLNQGILYLMLMPFAIVSLIGYRWWRGNKKYEEEQHMISKSE